MIRHLKLFIPLCLILAAGLVSTLILAKKRTSAHFPASQMSTPITPLDLSALTDRADLIAVGRVTTVSEEGSTTIDLQNSSIPARRMVALLTVNSILKGQADSSTLNFRFLVSEGPIGYTGIPTNQVRTFFLRETSPQEYEILNPYYPFIVASEDATPAGGSPLDKIVANLAHLLLTPAALLDNRMEAIRVLSSVKTEAATSALRQGAQDQNTSLGLAAAAALLRRNDISTLDMVVKSLLEPSQDINDSVRGDVVFALDRIKDPRAIPALARLLTEGDVQIRRQAAAALRHTGSSEAIGALARALDDSDQQVRYSAVTGLAEITGETQGMPSIEAFNKNESYYLAHWHGRVSKLILPQQP